jgi:hypothetical protein
MEYNLVAKIVYVRLNDNEDEFWGGDLVRMVSSKLDQCIMP